jgi:phosphatidylinositol alpha-mannosyltransferase
MKIGLVCPYDIFRGGGVQECVLAIQTELKSRGHEAKIITPNPRKNDIAPHEDIIMVGTSTDLKSPFHTTAQVSVSLDTVAMRKMLKAESFDVLHFHEPWVPVMSRQLLANSDSANVATFHAKLPETVMSKTIERVITPYTKSVMKYLDSLTAVSDAAASYVKTVTKEKVTIIPNGIDLNKYTPNKGHKVSDTPTILFIGRLEKRKGVRYLIEAFEIYVQINPAAKLKIAGNGPDRQKLEDYVKSHKIPNVEFLGHISEEQKQELFEQADLFCSPALFGESFGIVLLEAMAKGLVTLAGDNPGYASVLTGRGALSLVNPRDIPQFARQIDLLLSDHDVRELWRNWALEDVKRYTYPNVVDQYELMYTHALNQKGSKHKK